ncbi:FAD-binding protein [Myxococcota bacterium]|nr:FAD-binding protein [Myxococcota bacterium]
MPRWSNWARTISATPGELLCPRDPEELATMLSHAAAEGRRVKLPGSGHSWSGVAAPHDRWLMFHKMPRGVKVEGDLVRVTGNVTLATLCDALEAEGRMLPNLGSVTAQTVAGATATGTHGSGATLPILSAGVVELRLVTGAGELVTLGPDDPQLKDARVHLGALGVVTELTLRTLPRQRLQERLFNLPFDAVRERLDELVATHRHVKVWWLPKVGRAQVYTADLTDAPDTGPNALTLHLDRVGIQQPIFTLLLAIGRLIPALVPWIHRFAQATSFGDRDRVEDLRRVLSMPVPARHHEVELAIPREATHDALKEWWALLDRADYVPDFIQELRFVAPDDAALSPCYGRASAYLGGYAANPATAAKYIPAMLRLGREHAARPHWGKLFDHEHSELATLYPRWAEFQALRRRFDPAGVLVNPFIERVLGPVSP